MPSKANSRKAAILLTTLGGETVDATLAELGEKSSESIRTEIQLIESQPPAETERNEVLDEFETFLRFALETANVPASWMQEMLEKEVDNEKQQKPKIHSGDDLDDEEDEEEMPPRPPKIKLFQPTDDPFYDLCRLTPVQLAQALRVEQPRTIALVLIQLSKKQASEVIQYLPAKLQSSVVLEIGNQPSAPERLIERIILQTVQTASAITDAVAEEPDVNDELAQMLRIMPKRERSRIMDDIRQSEPEAAELISERLYLFEDIPTYDDRSIQKLLGQVDSATLVSALQGADSSINELILGNLSKRARSSVVEELELSPKLAEDEIEGARKNIAAAIANLDKDGQLSTR